MPAKVQLASATASTACLESDLEGAVCEGGRGRGGDVEGRIRRIAGSALRGC